jgi:hypothetical protein
MGGEMTEKVDQEDKFLNKQVLTSPPHATKTSFSNNASLCK